MARVTFAPAVSAARLGLASVQNPKNIYYYLFLLGPESVQNTVHALGRAGHRQRRGVQDSERVRRSAVSRPRWRGDCVGESIYCRESTWPEGCVAATAVESEWSPQWLGGGGLRCSRSWWYKGCRVTARPRGAAAGGLLNRGEAAHVEQRNA
jgi:hypothetical protein